MAQAKKKSDKGALKPDPSNLLPEATPVLKGGMPKALGVRVTSLTRKKVTGEREKSGDKD